MNKKITTNYFFNLLFQILTVITPLITTPYVARVLRPEGVGIYSYTATLANLFAMLASTGVASYGQREIAYHQEDIKARSQIFWELIIFRILSTLLVSCVYLWVSFQQTEYSLYLFLQLFVVLSVAIDVSWFFQGVEEFKIVSVRSCAFKLLSVILVFVLIKDVSHLRRYIFVSSLMSFLSLFVFLPELRKWIVAVPLKDLNITRHIRGNIEFFIPVIAVQLYSNLDKIMLGAAAIDIAESGYYEQSRKIVTIIVPLLSTINSVMHPRLANLYVHKRYQEIKALHAFSFRLILMLLIPLCAGLVIISDNFVNWFLGSDYTKVSLLIKLSIPLFAFMAVGNFVGVQYLSPTGKQNQMTAIYVTSAVINLILNSILIKHFFSVGALVASILAEAFSCFAQVYLMKRGEFNFCMTKGICKYVLSSIVMAVVLCSLNQHTGMKGAFATAVDIIVGATIYFTVLFLVREEILMQIFKKKKRK